MNLDIFLALHEHVIKHPDAVPYVIYKGDLHMRKTLFGAKAVDGPVGISYGVEQPDKQVLKDTLKKSKSLGLKRGDIFVFRKTPTSYEIIPGFGIVLSNLFGHDWTAEELERILKHEDIKAIVWDSPEGAVYYEKASPS